MTTSLLPPNATPLERALEAATARIGDVPVPLADLWNPHTCPLAFLPWLAWALSVDSWDPDWPEETKRAAVASSIDEHRHKGTRFAVEAVVERYDALIEIVEWHEAGGTGVPHTFEATLPMVIDGAAPGGKRSTAAFAEQIIRDIDRAKPLREHFKLLQRVDAAGMIGVQGVVRTVAVARTPVALGTDDSQPWATLLDDENGEPLQTDDGSFLDTTP